MDPLTLGIAAVGIGMSIFGGSKQHEADKHIAEANKAIAADEMQINEQKKQQMHLEAQRMQLQQFRNMQRLRAQATAAAVNQGALFGSGLQGGLAQVTDDAMTGVVGINQNLQIGDKITDINKDISGNKMKLADYQTEKSEGQAWSSLGGALVSSSGTIGNLGKNAFGGVQSAFSLFTPGSLSGGLRA